MDILKEPIRENIVLYTAQKKNEDLTKRDFVISTSISQEIAKAYKTNKINYEKEMNTIYAEEGAQLISTVNTSNKHFDRQGELIIPISELKNLVKIDKQTYLLTKNKKR